VIDPKDEGDLAIPHSVPNDLVPCGPRQAAIADVSQLLNNRQL
jgi:hypothetical protein